MPHSSKAALVVVLIGIGAAHAQEKPVVGLISKVGNSIKTPWGWTAEFKLPWANFPEFKAKAGEIIGIDCELCSSDGGQRVDRTFVYSGPAAVGSPSAFGRV